MPYSARIKGIRLRTLNLVMLVLSLCLFCAILYITFLIWKEYEQYVNVIDQYVSWERAAHQVHLGSDNLTEQARLFSQTGNKKYADNYFYELNTAKSREKASEFLSTQDINPEENHNLKSAIQLSNALTNLEIYAIRLIAEANRDDISHYPPEVRQMRLSASDRLLAPEAKMERGREILFGEQYLNNKNAIMGMLADVLNDNLARTSAQQQMESIKLTSLLGTQRLLLVALCILNILTFAMIIILIVKPLQMYLRAIRDDQMLNIAGAYEFRHLALTYNNIFLLKEKHDRMLKYKAEHDPLTGLLNRSAFDSLAHLLACESDPIALILADVDKFKEINDNYGHETGDLALKKVADLLKHSFRSDDLAIRLGGDEFAVVVMGRLPDFHKIIYEKISYINQTLQDPAPDFPKLSISAGVAISQMGFSELLYKHADLALYQVKEAGRCGCMFYAGEDK